MNGQVLLFVVIAVIMSAAAFGFIAWPVISRRREQRGEAGDPSFADAAAAEATVAALGPGGPSSSMPPDVALARTQLDQLKAALDAGVLSSEQFEEGKREIGRRLLEQVVSPGGAGPAVPAGAAAAIPRTAPHARQEAPRSAARTIAAGASEAPRRRWGLPGMGSRRIALVAGGAVVVCAAAIGLYFALGNPASLSPDTARAAKDDSSPHGLDPAKVRAMAAQLEEKLKTTPDDGQGWAMLARSYNAIGQYPEAVNAYKKAVALTPNDPQLLVDYADALAVSQGRKLDGEPMKMVERALELDPGNIKGLALKATDLFDRKDFSGAIALWERCIAAMPPGNEDLITQLKANIAEAKQLGGTSSAANAEPAAPGSAGASKAASASAAPSSTASRGSPAAATPGEPAAVRGVVTLADSLENKVSPNDTVFIFARAVDGPRMPVALLRRQVKDLPLQFTLDESTAMMPQLTLAQYPNVLVGARVSKTGDAAAKSGDLEGTAGPVKVGANDVRIEISRVVP